MKNKKKVSGKTKETILKLLDGVVSAACLMYAMRVLVTSTTGVIPLSYILLYLSLGGSKLLQGILLYKTDKIYFIKNMFSSAVFFTLGIVSCFVTLDNNLKFALTFTYYVVLLTERIFSVIKRHRLRNIIKNVILSLIFIVSGICSFAYLEQNMDEDLLTSLSYLHAFFVFVTFLLHIIYISFSQIKIDVLAKIIRKTFAAEILFGLVLLIVSFSIVFQAMEPALSSYEDALWYCFAIVTTIGFGDFTVITPMGRVLSVILGIYGIIVVALITSIIVNFYNEVKNIKERADLKEDAKKAAGAAATADVTEKPEKIPEEKQ